MNDSLRRDDCQRFDLAFQRLLDFREPIAGDHKIATHVETCARCRRRLETWQQIEQVLPAGDISVDDFFAGDVFAGDSAPSVIGPDEALWTSGQSGSVTRWHRALWSVAAVLLLAIGGLAIRSGWWRPNDQTASMADSRRIDPAESFPSVGPRTIETDPYRMVRDPYRATYAAAGDASVDIGRAVLPLGRTFRQAVGLLVTTGSRQPSMGQTPIGRTTIDQNVATKSEG